MSRLRIGELLVEARVISNDDLERALAVDRAPGQRLGDVLVQLGMVSEAQLTQILGQQHSVPWVSLYHVDFSRQLLNLIPRAIADKFCLIPIYVRRVKRQDTLYVAMADPSNDGALEEVSKVVGLPTKPMIAAPSDIRNAIRVYYGATMHPPAPPPGAMLSPRAVSNPPGPARSPVPSPAPPSPREEIDLESQIVPMEEIEAEEAAPLTLLEDPMTVEVAYLPGGGVLPVANVEPPRLSESGDSPDAEPEIEAREIIVKPKFGGPMVAITMLDGTTIQLPARRKKSDAPAAEAPAEDGDGGLTARDLIAALRATAQGSNAEAVLDDDGKWEKLFAALLSIMLRKGLIADWEFIEELRKM